MKSISGMRITPVLLWASIFASFYSHSHSQPFSQENMDLDDEGEAAYANDSVDLNDTTATANISPSNDHESHNEQIQSQRAEAIMKMLDEKSNLLEKVQDISSKMRDLCMLNEFEILQGVHVSTEFAYLPVEKIDLIVAFLYKLMKNKRSTNPKQKDDEDLYTYILNTLHAEPTVESLRLLIYKFGESSQILYIPMENRTVRQEMVHDKDIIHQPWFYNPKDSASDNKFVPPQNLKHYMPRQKLEKDIGSRWTWPYFNCSSVNLDANHHESKSNETVFDRGHWLVSYTAWFPITPSINGDYQIMGELSFDADLTAFDINQCGFESETDRPDDERKSPLHFFRDTHKCDRITNSSNCHFISGKGWQKGSYECRCCNNTFAYNKTLNNTISGMFAEVAWETWRNHKINGNDSVMYPTIVSCKKCPEGCDNCVDGVSCMAPMNWVFRMILLCVSIICSVGSIGLVLLTYKFRKLPVFKTSSPIFHCITLLGCLIMYSEMLVLFPVLSQASCVAVKWTRHLGFSITYTALYMKLCRVYLTFRVKSAHKIKLTEKHLLHWMSPIMVIMLLYLFAWTISDPPSIEFMYTLDNLKFHQCVYNWWDHALAIGEVIFLAYGVWICWRIRENPDAQFISYSIYSIAFVNVLMVSLHLLIVPQAGPDTKYLLAFLRTQMSTTLTIAFVFGSKLCSVLRGDPSALKEIPNSANGFGHETLDLGEENQQLKEELQKMATQIERLKSYAMCKNNPHLKQSSINISNADVDFNHLESLTTL